MRPGRILVAEHNGVYVIKLDGDVRLTLCVSFDQFIQDMFGDDHFYSVLFDLTSAEAIDSTTLGLMAKIAIIGQRDHEQMPDVVSTNPGINRILDTMGFDSIFNIVEDTEVDTSTAQALPFESCDEVDVKPRVIEAHRILMEMNKTNRDTFKDLVASLEAGL